MTAIYGTEIKIIEHLSTLMTACHSRRPRVLCLGYPAILADEDTFARLSVVSSWESIAKHQDSPTRWQANGITRETPMCETRSLFTKLGCDLVVLGQIQTKENDLVFDLNLPLSTQELRAIGPIDLIIDHSTSQKKFNIAQVFLNLDNILTHQGIIYHQTALCFPNKGLWGINPTTFYYFYQTRHYLAGRPYCWIDYFDQNNFEPILKEILPFTQLYEFPRNIMWSFIFQKERRHIRTPENKYPIQRCYSSNNREISMINYLHHVLPSTHLIPLQ